MITLWSNTDNDVILFLEDYPFYLFVFTNGCDEYADVFTKEDCDKKFTINIDYPNGVYVLKIYGQEDYSNLNGDMAELLKTTSAKVKSGDPCYMGDNLLDEFDYDLTDENDNILIE